MDITTARQHLLENISKSQRDLEVNTLALSIIDSSFQAEFEARDEAIGMYNTEKVKHDETKAELATKDTEIESLKDEIVELKKQPKETSVVGETTEEIK